MFTAMFKALDSAPRLLLEGELRPVQGDRFQPTGFADLGAALYYRADGTRMVLVESAQSVANRLEQTCLDGGGPRLNPELKGLPYILVTLTGATETEISSLVEAHRLNSPFIISDPIFQAKLKKEMGYASGQPLDWKKIARAIFQFDPNSLLHGVFLANLEDGRIKIPRMITGFIEAEDVQEVALGGVKNNPLDPGGSIRAAREARDVYSNVPYHRMEYTAKRIRTFFNLDLALLKGYGLEEEAETLLKALSLYKIRRFLSEGLRLRTACDFDLVGTLTVTRPKEFQLPEESALLKTVQEAIKACEKKGLWTQDQDGVTHLTTKTVSKAKEPKKEKSEGEEEVDETLLTSVEES